MGGRLTRDAAPSRPSRIEARMVQAMAERAQSGKFGLKSFNSIIMKFPKIDKSFQDVRAVFKKFDANGNGSIDLDELQLCFKELQVTFAAEEVQAFYAECDMDSSHGIDFKEFIVVLALVYLLGAPPTSSGASSQGEIHKSRIGLPQLETTFDTIVEAFVFFDRDKDGYVSKDELVGAINEISPGKQGARIGMQRFEEMDWDKDGKITFKEFLFAFTDWVGLEDETEEE